MSTTKLLIQPSAGIAPLIQAIDDATATVHIIVFRFDRRDLEAALRRAAKRGVFVHALVANTSTGQGGESTLRRLEMRLLADGMSVARTATDLVRYHDKVMIVDSRLLLLLAFNYTHLDIDRSRGFGIVTDNPEWVQEAERLFAADTMRQPYQPECDAFVVSPINARRQLLALLASAKRQLLIYDDKLSDLSVMRLLAAKVRAGVDVRMIGSAGKRAVGVEVTRLSMRLHSQIIVRDGELMFLGSQSLRSVEMDGRREVGILIEDRAIVDEVVATFEADWKASHNAHRIPPVVADDAEPALEQTGASSPSNGHAWLGPGGVVMLLATAEGREGSIETPGQIFSPFTGSAVEASGSEEPQHGTVP